MKFSIITCTYNSEATIRDAIESVLAQDYPHVEYLVIDGKSTDRTLDIARSYSHRIDRILSEPDNGIYEALNKGIAMATGDVTGILHSDDLYASNQVLSKVAEIFMREQADAVYGDLLYVSQHNPKKIIRYWKAGQFKRENLRRGWMPPHPAVFLQTQLYRKFGMYNTEYHIAADYELMLRMLGRHQIHPVYLPEILIKMRMGGVSNKSLTSILRKMREDYLAMRYYGTGNWPKLALKTLIKLTQLIRR